MSDNESRKLTGIRQIVRLKEILQKWQSITLGPKSLATNKRHGNSKAACDSDDETSQSSKLPHDVPKGYLAVYVGLELRRFIIPTSYLSHSLFKLLLEKVEEEYGFDHSGALTIPCEIETFKYLIQCIEAHPNEGSTGGKELSTEEE